MDGWMDCTSEWWTNNDDGNSLITFDLVVDDNDDDDDVYRSTKIDWLKLISSFCKTIKWNYTGETLNKFEIILSSDFFVFPHQINQSLVEWIMESMESPNNHQNHCYDSARKNIPQNLWMIHEWILFIWKKKDSYISKTCVCQIEN